MMPDIRPNTGFQKLFFFKLVYIFQDILYACTVADRLSKLDLELLQPTDIEAGKIYIQNTDSGNGRSRFVVVELKHKTATVKFLDTQATEDIGIYIIVDINYFTLMKTTQKFFI